MDAINSTINIDAIDIRDILDGDGMLAAFDASVSATNTERMKDLVEQIESKIASVAPIIKYAVSSVLPRRIAFTDVRTATVE